MDTASQSGRSRARKPPLGQLLICTGCCCGRTEKGFPAVPVGRVKAAWKGGVNRTIQLTISGCLGPCARANVVLLITPEAVEWFGGLEREALYDDLTEWASRCHSVGTVLQLPTSLEAHRFEWLAVDNGGTHLPVARPAAVAPALGSGGVEPVARDRPRSNG